MSSKRAFGSFMCFLFVLFSYIPLKAELVLITENATLTNNAIGMINTVFGLFWALLATIFLGASAYWAMKT